LNKTFSKRLVIMTIILISIFQLPVFAIAQQTDASATITSAKQQLITCLDSAKQAEATGANISSLTSVLDDAGDLLSRAELSYSQSDFGAAQSLATGCIQKLSNFISESNALRDAAAQQQSYDFWVNFVGSIAGTFAVIVAGFVVLRFINKRQVPREPETEVKTDEST
jgi:hypothetical protein